MNLKNEIEMGFFLSFNSYYPERKKQDFLPLPISYGDMGEISEQDRHTPCMKVSGYHLNISHIKVSIKESLSKCVINHCKTFKTA